MPSPISTQDLLDKCKRFVLADPITESLDLLIQDAIISADRSIPTLDMVPLAWMRTMYDGVRTKYMATIDSITQADPAIVTAETKDPDADGGHGFEDDDVVIVYGGDMEQLTGRYFLVETIDDDTFYLRDINDLDRIDASGYTEYIAGGAVYHAGVTLPASTIEPGINWHINDVYAVWFDSKPVESLPLDSLAFRQEPVLAGGTPSWYRYERFGYTSQLKDDISHRLYFQPTGTAHNVILELIKGFEDIDIWDDSVYPLHPPETHDYIWHKALANLATNAERQRRTFARAGDIVGDNTRIEVLYAQMWEQRAMEDEIRIVELSRRLLGQQKGGYSTGIRG
jgi:hypothetical protein